MIEIADARVGGVVPALWLLALQNAINTTAASWGEVIEFKGCRCVSQHSCCCLPRAAALMSAV